MPIPVLPGQVPTIISKPNQRFATTALSTKYRVKAVNGEILKDEVTGEIFYKRKEDGKVVSFFQNKKQIQDLVLELRILLNTNMGFRYPADTESSFFISTNYDLTLLNKEKLLDIYTSNLSIDNSNKDSIYTYHFKISNVCNGFFMEVDSRDCDKPAIEVTTNYYNQFMKNYVGDSALFLAEKEKFNKTKWEESNATIRYRVKCIKGGMTKIYECEDYVRMNEHCFINLPDLDIMTDFGGHPESMEIFIDQITFDKLQFMFKNAGLIGGNYSTLLKKYMYEDNRLEVQLANVMYFVDRPEDWEELGNEIVVAFMDTPYFFEYMGNVATLNDNGDFIFSVRRPYSNEWKVNGVWAEMIRTIDINGDVKNTGSENSDRWRELEEIFGPNRIHHGKFTFDETKRDHFPLADRITISFNE